MNENYVIRYDAKKRNVWRSEGFHKYKSILPKTTAETSCNDNHLNQSQTASYNSAYAKVETLLQQQWRKDLIGACGQNAGQLFVDKGTNASP